MRISILQSISIACVSLLSNTEAQQATLTVQTNPAAGGTITGGGIYSVGSGVSIIIKANDGWYVTNVIYSGPSTYPTLNPAQQFIKMLAVDEFDQPGFDPSTITNDSVSLTLTANSTVMAVFAPLSPTLGQQPESQTVIEGSPVTLSGTASGRQPITYQWQLDGTNIADATSTGLSFTSVGLTNAGTYVLVASNPFGTNASTPAVLEVEEVGVFVNGLLFGGQTFTNDSPAYIELQSAFPNGDIFYTLDDSEPDFNGTPYEGPFLVTTTSTLRAVAYSEDFEKTALSIPLAIFIIPSYTLSISSGGGTVTVSPPYGPYPSNSTVTLYPSADVGWTFMGWAGAITGTNATPSITMNQDEFVQAIFGTTVSTTAAGNGTASISPLLPLYPYGMTVEVSAVPEAGNYFDLWGDAASGNGNPLNFAVMSATQIVSSLFAPLPTNQCSLAVLSVGGGTTALNPVTNRFQTGTSVVVTATPILGQQFLGWSGNVTGTANPLSLVMNSNMVVTANFSRITTLSLTEVASTLSLNITGVPGDIYDIETSTNFSTWVPLCSVTNFFGAGSFSAPISLAVPLEIYRAQVH